jgi:hypothetical protein
MADFMYLYRKQKTPKEVATLAFFLKNCNMKPQSKDFWPSGHFLHSIR